MFLHVVFYLFLCFFACFLPFFDLLKPAACLGLSNYFQFIFALLLLF